MIVSMFVSISIVVGMFVSGISGSSSVCQPYQWLLICLSAISAVVSLNVSRISDCYLCISSISGC